MEIKNNFITNKIIDVKIKDISLFKNVMRNSVSESDINTLAASIKKNGLLVPLTVRRDIKNSKKYILVSGLRRYLALEFLGAKTVPVIVLSLTEAEADMYLLCEDELSKKLTLFEKSEAMGNLLISGRITKSELADAMCITVKNLEKRLSILKLTKDEKEVITNHHFSNEFVFLFLSLEKEKRQEILNHIIVKSLTNEEAIKYIKEASAPKKEPIKSGCITDDTIIMNSIERMAGHLVTSGINASCRRNDTDEKTEYILSIEKHILNRQHF